jgi:CRISPR-associated protein Cmr2
MSANNDTLWQTKLAARLHDPAEKALVLLRDPAGHENGSSRALARLSGLHDLASEAVDADNDEALAKTLFKNGIPHTMYQHVQRADWWAAAADRPQWPMQEITVNTDKGEKKTLAVAPWAQVRWANEPVLIHPLTGDAFKLPGGLAETDFHDIKQRSFDHVAGLFAALDAQNSSPDWKKTLLTLWRFGPEVTEENNNDKLGALWHLLPADTRVPDHSIWDHLDLTSAFAGAFAADIDGGSALLSLSIGPVQPFIAAARKMDDLWAGSHLLARLSWEAMKEVCERLGPDAILFPRLRGVPQVDLWLRDECGLPESLFEQCNWNRGGTDSNPLFSAALPNRFVAVVPAAQAEGIARAVETRVRAWLQKLGQDVVVLLLHEAGYEDIEGIDTPYAQMRAQLAGFPEVHWAVIPFSLIKSRNPQKQTDLDTVALSAAMAPFFGKNSGAPCGFLATPAWQLLQKELQIDSEGEKSVFFAPNPGVLYPAVHDLAERALAAAKSARACDQTEQHGWRCALTGETEWITTDREQLKASYRHQDDTLWARIARKKPAWAKKGEHLGALPAIKRLWPTLFAEEVGKALGNGNDSKDIGRFVVSTHTMALAHQLDRWLKEGAPRHDAADPIASEPVALPRKLMRAHGRHPALDSAKRLPGLLDAARDADDDRAWVKAQQTARDLLGIDALETYYALVLMDGDRIGAWLSGSDTYAISYRDSFHPQVRQGFDAHAARQEAIRKYGQQHRALSPSRHLAISGALNDFSLSVARHVVEEEHLGRLIYAGGDDVFAMLPVADLFSAMQRLRYAYSGHDPEHEGGIYQGLTLHNGFALLDGRLMRMMGRRATASCGAVIAHHQAPLPAVRRELAAAERRAKNKGGRDAFSLTIVKRSGGALKLTDKWGEPVNLLAALRAFLTQEDVSRRAVYHTLEWLNDRELPEPAGNGDLLESLLAYQLDRQAKKASKPLVPDLARRLVALTLGWPEGERIAKLRNFLSVAEFLARESRTGGEA